ncbi:FkbM family methyltransferase [Vibrio lentus]|uniref:FkbM family methyltransferase n=1 Tax=Vibrio lentus TaxID=136468 RepID=UPI000C852B73|nr:FkbM family methyltransferase [Vibrio lentus]PMJ07728.1 hypothetical protein BCU30_08880 [Vibrio lentus]PMN68828.1 hypothetical protein BCT26_08300 [Vibrio lentus]
MSKIEKKIEKVVFYFPWIEVSGGPIYLVRLAEELAKDGNYSVHYVDYAEGFSNKLISNDKVNKVTVSLDDFSIPFDDPITIITPIYFAAWLPKLNPNSKILFINWHLCSIDTLKYNWQTSGENINEFLSLVHETKSVMFCDESHRLGQNTKNINFEKNIVPITLSNGGNKALGSLVNQSEINMAILGRLCQDKIYSVLNFINNLEKLKISEKKIVHIIGDGPERDLIDTDKFKSIEIIFTGTLSQPNLRDYLATKCDCLFAMGTSVLEGAAVSLPSVIIPHNMKPMSCDSYVYIQDTPGYCLGWYDDQFDDLCLSPVPLRNIVSDLLSLDSKGKLGESAFKYYKEHHTIESAVDLFKTAISNTSLSSDRLIKKTGTFQGVFKRLSLGNFDFITFNKTLVGIDAKALGRFKLFSLRNDTDPRWKIFSWSKFDLFRVSRSRKFFQFSFANTKAQELKNSIENSNSLVLSKLCELQDSISAKKSKGLDEDNSLEKYNNLQMKVDSIETRLFEKLDRIHFDKVIELDTCDKLLSKDSLQYFCSDIDEAYASLVKGLDEKSKTIVNTIINRIQNYVKNSTSMFLMTRDEIDEYTKMVEHHSSKLVTVGHNKFVYGKFKLPINIITSTVFYYDCFMPELLLLEKYREKDIIDAGGSFGDSAIVLSGYTDKTIHVFEPTTKMFDLAKKTVEYNNLDEKIVLNKLALGDKRENQTIQVADDFSSFYHSSDNEDKIETEVVNIETLDDYVARNDIDVGVIKVDVEGYEEKLLDGAIRTITRDKPALILSIYHSSEQFFWIKNKIEELDLGYTFKIRKPLDRSIIVDTMLIAEVID